ncbi:unnamed protein product [Caenorhabditis bovis]|uniref:non-specific protein-tyrosine kinase n=1 Tax=Caenorhabditis bovis TaxID=2654633 RepID=A0A8S1FCA7_9PELO|nr:unnamed protein product [Caenorhabditis bovis]
MGIKGDSKKQPTSEQVRMARLTLEGNSADDEASKIQKMIKKVMEMTSCSQSEAEIALFDNDNNIHAAIEHILENDKLDSWTDPKAKKEKKKPEEERATGRTGTASNFQRGRGNGGFVDRGGRGRSNGAPREHNRENNREHNRENNREHNREHNGPQRGKGGFDRPSTFNGRGGRGGGRGGYSRAVAPEAPQFQEEVESNQVNANLSETSPPVEESVTTTVPTSSAPGPISFAAVAAAAHRKELNKQQQQKQLHSQNIPKRRSVSPAPDPAKEESSHVFDEPESSRNNNKEENFYQCEPSSAEEPLASASTHVENVQKTPNQANVWTNQLKSELGIGMPESNGVTSPIPSNVSIPSLPDPGVEFVGCEPTSLVDISFGFVETPPTSLLPPAETSSASISTNNSDMLFNHNRVQVQQKTLEQERVQMNNDFNLKSSSPPNPYGQSNSRSLSYDTSSVSYTPSNDRGLASNKTQFNQATQMSQQQQQVQQQQVQQQQAQQQQQQAPQQQQQPPQQTQQNQHHPQQQPLMFQPHLPYAPYSYMNMYNPVAATGVRDEYAALMQYGMGVDLTNLSTILPTTQISQAPQSQQISSSQHRGETHGLMDINKFGTQTTRDQQQPSNVGPPPGFQAASYMQQPNLTSLFMQQPYQAAGPHPFGFMNMVQSVGNNGAARQMYGQEDDRKSYEKMSAKPTQQPNSHSQYSHNNGNVGMHTALVVGATSRLGKAIVQRLAFAGFKIAATGDCPNSVGKIAEDNKKLGGDVTAFSFDSSNDSHRKELIEKVIETLGSLDTLIVVPPQNELVGEILDCTEEQFDKVFADKLTIPFRMVQAALPALSESKNGSVVFLTSCLGYTPSVDMGMFSVASNSVLGLTKAVSASAAKLGVRVNSVVTGMVEGDNTGAVWDHSSDNNAKIIKQQLEAMIPLGRIGRPSDVASYVEFLASTKSRYITGENCIVSDKNVVVILKGAQKCYIAPDVPNNFRQCSYFRYLTGITSPNLYYIMTSAGCSSKFSSILVADRRSAHDELWEGKLPSESEWEQTARFDEIIPTNRMLQTLEKLCDENTIVYHETDDSMMSKFIHTKASAVRSINPLVDQLRLVKSANELEAVRDVCLLGSQTMSAMIASSKDVPNENVIVGLLEYEGRRRGSEMQAYPPVVAGGSRANTIHYLDANHEILPGECVLVDAGCDLNGYVSDITRCFPINGLWSDAQRSLYEALLYAHEQLLEYAHNMEKVKLSKLFQRMNELLASSFLELGLIKAQNSADMLNLAEKLCPHHVSHYLGMDVHDCASVSRDIELPANVVFTVEPGVYVPFDWPVKEFRGIGYRIEDDVVTCSGGGIELLTAAVPRDIEDIQSDEVGRVNGNVENYAYYHGYMTKEEAESMLCKNGDFIVRKTEIGTHLHYVISCKTNGKFYHILIKRTKTKKLYWTFKYAFKSVSDLIDYHKRNQFPVFAQVYIEHPVAKQEWQLNHEQVLFSAAMAIMRFFPVDLQQKIGEGQFGEVHLGILKPNVVKFYGVCTTKEPIMIVMEFCDGKSLEDVLLNIGYELVSDTRVKYLFGVACGMKYLHNEEIIHRDIAARNCLLNSNDVIKISDFGLSVKGVSVKEKRGGRLPVKYMAPETLKRGVYSTASDVYSYGALIYEVYMNGKVPFDDSKLSGNELRKAIIEKKIILELNTSCPIYVKELFKGCREYSPELRPKFAEIREFLMNVGSCKANMKDAEIDDIPIQQQLLEYLTSCWG